MNKLQKRITELETLLNVTPAVSSKRLLPEWLLHNLHEETGLSFDTDQTAMDRIRRMQAFASVRLARKASNKHEKRSA